MTQIPLVDLKFHLVPMISKVNILNKVPNKKDFDMTDVFSLNNGFKNNLFKIKIPVAQAKELKTAEKNEVAEKVDEDRRHMVEATIVKVMKTRRR